jgi:hypothetical protein
VHVGILDSAVRIAGFIQLIPVFERLEDVPAYVTWGE